MDWRWMLIVDGCNWYENVVWVKFPYPTWISHKYVPRDLPSFFNSSLDRLISGLQSMYRVKVNSFSVLCRNEVRIPWPTMNLPIPILVRYQSGGDMNLNCGFEPLNSKYNISFILLFWPVHFWIGTFSQLWQNMYCDIITENFNWYYKFLAKMFRFTRKTKKLSWKENSKCSEFPET